MTKLLTISATITLGAITLAALACGWTVLMLGHHITYSMAEVDATLREINRPCGKKESCGTLADVAKTLNTFRGAAGQLEVAAAHENKQLTTIDKQEAQIYADVHTSLTDLHGELLNVQELTASLNETTQQATATLRSTDHAVKTMDSTIQAAQPVLDNSSIAMGHLDALLTAPDLIQAMAHANAMTASGDRIMGDAAFEADKLTHPPKAKLTFWGGVWLVTQKVHSVLPPLF